MYLPFGMSSNCLLLFVMILLLMTYTQLRCFAYRQYGFLFLLVIVALACMLEHHLMEYYYNVFPLMAFSGRRLFKDDPIPAPAEQVREVTGMSRGGTAAAGAAGAAMPAPSTVLR